MDSLQSIYYKLERILLLNFLLPCFLPVLSNTNRRSWTVTEMAKQLSEP